MIDRKFGTLEPIIYFENSRGDIVMPPDTPSARYFYSEKRDARGLTYRDHGFEWREAGTLEEVDRLQKRLNDHERRKAEAAAERDEEKYRERSRSVRDSLYGRMVSSSTSPYEKEFIKYYLQLREEKRERHRQRFLEATSYLWAREMDKGTLPQDRILS